MTTITATRTSTLTAPVAVTTAARFLGHFLAALVGVVFLGRDLEH